MAGVDDPAGRRIGGEAPGGGGARFDEAALLAPGRRQFCLLLKHRPEIDPRALGRFDLQLSGHTHKGQIFPFGLVVALSYPRMAGFFGLGEGSSLFVSRGAGTWGPPLRLLSPPEVALVEILPAS